MLTPATQVLPAQVLPTLVQNVDAQVPTETMAITQPVEEVQTIPVTESVQQVQLVPIQQVQTVQPVQPVQAVQQVQAVPITQSIQQVVPVQAQVVNTPQIVLVPQIIQPPKPLAPSPLYTSYIPPTPTKPKEQPVYQYYKLVPLTTSYVQVPIEQTAVIPTNTTTVDATPIV